MKHNVDLTLNRDFNKFKFGNLSLILNPRKYPWSTKGLMDKYEFENEIVKTGNSVERNRKRDSGNFGTRDICECCGKDLSSRPWNIDWGLCIRCKTVMDSEHKEDGEFLFKKKFVRPN